MVKPMRRLGDPEEFDEMTNLLRGGGADGLKVVKTSPTTIDRVVWAKRYKTAKKRKPTVTISKNRFYVNVIATKLISPGKEKYKIGAGDYGEERVLLIQRNDHGEKNENGKVEGYCLFIQRQGNCEYAMSTSKSLIRQLHASGIDEGKYELVGVAGRSDLWVGRRMDD